MDIQGKKLLTLEADLQNTWANHVNLRWFAGLVIRWLEDHRWTLHLLFWSDKSAQDHLFYFTSSHKLYAITWCRVNKPDINFALFLSVTSALPKWPSLREERTSKVLFIRKYGPDTNFTLFLLLTLPLWPWIKVMIQPISNICVNYELPMCLSKEDMDWEHILHFSCPWPCTKDLWSWSRYTFRSQAFFVWS